MSRTYHHGKNHKSHIRVRVVKRKRPDFKLLSRALIELAEAELEKEAECEYRRKTKKTKGGRS